MCYDLSCRVWRNHRVELQGSIVTFALFTLAAAMASTWQCLMVDGRRLGRDWLRERLLQETSLRLRQLVVDAGAASSSHGSKADCVAQLLQMFDASPPVSCPCVLCIVCLCTFEWMEQYHRWSGSAFSVLCDIFIFRVCVRLSISWICRNSGQCISTNWSVFA